MASRKTPDKPSAEVKPNWPSIGRIVHYVEDRGHADIHVPAIVITAPDPDGDGVIPCLVVANEANDYRARHVAHDATGKTGGTWHWPEMFHSGESVSLTDAS